MYNDYSYSPMGSYSNDVTYSAPGLSRTNLDSTTQYLNSLGTGASYSSVLKNNILPNNLCSGIIKNDYSSLIGVMPSHYGVKSNPYESEIASFLKNPSSVNFSTLESSPTNINLSYEPPGFNSIIKNTYPSGISASSSPITAFNGASGGFQINQTIDNIGLGLTSNLQSELFPPSFKISSPGPSGFGSLMMPGAYNPSNVNSTISGLFDNSGHLPNFNSTIKEGHFLTDVSSLQSSVDTSLNNFLKSKSTLDSILAPGYKSSNDFLSKPSGLSSLYNFDSSPSSYGLDSLYDNSLLKPKPFINKPYGSDNLTDFRKNILGIKEPNSYYDSIVNEKPIFSSRNFKTSTPFEDNLFKSSLGTLNHKFDFQDSFSKNNESLSQKVNNYIKTDSDVSISKVETNDPGSFSYKLSSVSEPFFGVRPVPTILPSDINLSSFTLSSSNNVSSENKNINSQQTGSITSKAEINQESINEVKPNQLDCFNLLSKNVPIKPLETYINDSQNKKTFDYKFKNFDSSNLNKKDLEMTRSWFRETFPDRVTTRTFNDLEQDVTDLIRYDYGLSKNKESFSELKKPYFLLDKASDSVLSRLDIESEDRMTLNKVIKTALSSSSHLTNPSNLELSGFEKKLYDSYGDVCSTKDQKQLLGHLLNISSDLSENFRDYLNYAYDNDLPRLTQAELRHFLATFSNHYGDLANTDLRSDVSFEMDGNINNQLSVRYQYYDDFDRGTLNFFSEDNLLSSILFKKDGNKIDLIRVSYTDLENKKVNSSLPYVTGSFLYNLCKDPSLVNISNNKLRELLSNVDFVNTANDNKKFVDPLIVGHDASNLSTGALCTISMLKKFYKKPSKYWDDFQSDLRTRGGFNECDVMRDGIFYSDVDNLSKLETDKANRIIKFLGVEVMDNYKNISTFATDILLEQEKYFTKEDYLNPMTSNIGGLVGDLRFLELIATPNEVWSKVGEPGKKLDYNFLALERFVKNKGRSKYFDNFYHPIKQYQKEIETDQNYSKYANIKSTLTTKENFTILFNLYKNINKHKGDFTVNIEEDKIVILGNNSGSVPDELLEFDYTTQRKKIFNLGTSTKSELDKQKNITGVGMYALYEIIKANEGCSIDINNVKDGVVTRIELPIYKEEFDKNNSF